MGFHQTIKETQKFTTVSPDVANLCRGKTRQGASDVLARSLGQAEAYLTVREVLAEASRGADGALWREFGGFDRFRFATLGLLAPIRKQKADSRTINPINIPARIRETSGLGGVHADPKY